MNIDLKKSRGELYSPPVGRFVEVVVPPSTYLAFDGVGDPDTSPEYGSALGALYACAYAIRSSFKRRTDAAFVVGPLSGLWSADDPSAFLENRRAEWEWTMMLPLPDEVSRGDIEVGLGVASVKKPNARIDDVYVYKLDEGISLQTMYVGPYSEEGLTLARLHDEVMPALGYTFNGRHHEIYLGDPRKVAPERLRTILRHPVKPLI